MSSRKILSVVVPAYGEGGTIFRDISRLEGVLGKIRHDYEIIVVVDGLLNSEDRTLEEARKLENVRVKVLNYSSNRGKGYAVRYGMARAKGDMVAFIDSGLEISPNSLNLALEHFEWYDADIIVGSKRHPASKVVYPRIRKVLSFGYRVFVWMLFGLKVRDTQVGMKIFRREVLDEILPRLLVKRYAFDVEMLALAYALGFKKIYESPVELHYNFNFTVNSSSIYHIYKMIWDALAVYYRLNILRYYSIKNSHNWLQDPDLNIGAYKLSPRQNLSPVVSSPQKI